MDLVDDPIGEWDLEGPQFLSELRAALEFQTAHCAVYRFLCSRQQFSPQDDLQQLSDLAKIPYFTSNVFKESRGLYERLLTLPSEEVSCWTYSSGTHGDRSIVGRTDAELSACRRAYRAVLSELAGHAAFDECLLVFPEPSQQLGEGSGAAQRRGRSGEAAATKTSHGSREAFGALVARAVDDAGDSSVRRYLARWDEAEQRLALDAPALLERLRELDQQGKTIFLGGPPALLQPILHRQEREEPFTFGDRCTVQLGGGGWDVVARELQVDRERARAELVGRLSELLGINPARLADCYGATETAAALPAHFSPGLSDFLFHQPPWTRLIIRDPQSLAPLTKPGGLGLLEIIMPYGTRSFAGAAILMDDVAQLISLDGCPECGRAGMTLRIVGRVSPSGDLHRGCGAVLRP